MPVLWLTACGDDDGPTNAVVQRILSEVRLNFTSLTLFVGETENVVATVLDAAGATVDISQLTNPIVWTSSDPSVAVASPEGLVSALGAGVTTLQATVEGVSASMVVTVLNVPSSIVTLDGQAKTGSVGDRIEDGVAMRLRDNQGRGVPGIRVRFTVLTGGGSASPAEIVTDTSGLANTAWELGPTAGEQQLEVRALLSSGASGVEGNGVQRASPQDLVVVFTATAEADPPALVVLAPAAQTLASGATGSLSFSVTDAFGNAVEGESVTYTSSDPAVASPDASGGFTAGTVGTTTVTGTLVSNPTITGVATITVEPGAPATLTKISGDGQSGLPAAALADPLVVEVKDVGGNLLSGVTVQWAVASGPGTVAAATSVTDAAGRASMTATFGATGGVVSITSSVDGVTPVSFSATSAFATLAITTTSPLPGGNEGQAYSATIAASGGDGSYTWSLTGGPAWLSINSATGELSGTAQPGSYTFDVAVASGDGQNATMSFSLSVAYAGVAISTASPLPDGLDGSAYSQTVAATGGDGSYTWSISGAPSWLSINTATGQLSGTAKGGVYAFDVSVASGDGQNATKSFAITVAFRVLDITTTSPLPTGIQALPYAHTLTATGGDGAYTWALTSAPSWLSVNPSTGALSGVAQAGEYTFTIGVTSGDGQSVARLFDLIISSTPLEITTASPLPTGNSGAAYSRTLSASGGDGNYTWGLSGAPGWLTINSSTGVISGTAVTGTHNFTATVNSGDGQVANKAFSLTVAPGAFPVLDITTTTLPGGTRTVAYSQTVAATGGDGSYTWSLASGSLPAGLTLNTGTGAITGTPTAAGTSNFTVQVNSGDGQTDTQALSIVVAHPTPTITTASLPGGTRTVAYSQTLAATGGDGTTYAWAITVGTLPAGLSLNAGTGAITGTPTAAGTSNFTVQVTSGGLSATKALSIVVAHPAPSITTASLPNGTRTVAYSQTLAATGGDGVTYAWAITAGALAAGLSLNASTGEISGTPTAAGTFNVTYQVTSGGLSATKALTLTVVHPPPAVTTTTLAAGSIGVAYSQTVAATGGDGVTYAWAITAGALPGGLSLNAGSGAITGTPTAPPGTFNFTVQVTSNAQTATQALSITTTYPPPSISTTSLPDVLVNLPYDETAVATLGDGTTYAWAVTAGSLPTGTSLNAGTGAITGTPTVLGTYNFTLQVTSAAQTDSKALSISVNQSSEPAGFAAIIERPFNSKAANSGDRGTGSLPNKTGGSEGWDGVESAMPNLTIVAGTDPLSPGSAMRFTYPVGHPVASGPGTTQTLDYPVPPSELYIRTAVRLGPTYFSNGVSNKLYFHRMSGSPRGEPFLALFPNAGTNTFWLAANFQGTPDNGLGWVYSSGKGQTIERERWYVIETLAIMNSAQGVKDGIFRVWLNGSLILERTDAEFNPAGGTFKWGTLHVSPTFGGGGGLTTNPTEFYWDLGHAYISGRN